MCTLCQGTAVHVPAQLCVDPQLPSCQLQLTRLLEGCMTSSVRRHRDFRRCSAPKLAMHGLRTAIEFWMLAADLERGACRAGGSGRIGARSR